MKLIQNTGCLHDKIRFVDHEMVGSGTFKASANSENRVPQDVSVVMGRCAQTVAAQTIVYTKRIECNN